MWSFRKYLPALNRPEQSPYRPVEKTYRPVQASTCTLQASTGTLQASTGPLQTSTEIWQASTGTLQTSTEAVPASIGSLQTSTEIWQASTGTLQTKTSQYRPVQELTVGCKLHPLCQMLRNQHTPPLNVYFEYTSVLIWKDMKPLTSVNFQTYFFVCVFNQVQRNRSSCDVYKWPPVSSLKSQTALYFAPLLMRNGVAVMTGSPVRASCSILQALMCGRRMAVKREKVNTLTSYTVTSLTSHLW